MAEQEAVSNVNYYGDSLNITLSKQTGAYAVPYGPNLFEVTLRREDEPNIYFGFVKELVVGGGTIQSLSFITTAFPAEINVATHLRFIRVRKFEDYGETKISVMARRTRV